MKLEINPPKKAAKILDSLCNRFNLPEISGDLYELFYKRVNAGKHRKAKLFFWMEMLRAILSMWITYQRRKKKHPYIFSSMISFNIKIGIRHIIKRPVYSLITITGLALGIGACLLIFDYVNYEKSFDRNYPFADRIVMMQYHFKPEDFENKSPAVPYFVGPKVMREFPEVELQTRILPSYGSRVFKIDDRLFEESDFAFADSTLLNVLSYKLLAGKPKTQLNRPFTAILSKHTALRFFGNENPVGKTFLYNDTREYEVTGVFDDIPSNSHIRFDFFLSLMSLEIPYVEKFDSPNFLTYLKLANGTSVSEFEAKFNNEWKERLGEYLKLPIQPLLNVHFDTSVGNYGGHLKITDPSYLLIFSIVATLVLLIACINYINLVTARANERGREVGIRKLSGAANTQLSIQFMFDSFLHIFPAVAVGLLLYFLIVPYTNNFLGLFRDSMAMTEVVPIIKMAGVILLLVTLVAGFYPSLIISRMKPALTLKGKFSTSKGAVSFRKGLVVFQFSISIILIIGAMVVASQLDYMRSKKLGYDKEHILILSADSKMLNEFDGLNAEMKKLSFVKEVSAASVPPTEILIGHGININGMSDELRIVGGVHVTHDFLEALNIKLVAGRNFTPHQNILTDSGAFEFIVNQTFLTKFGLSESDALGREMNLGGRGVIIGIMQDFHPGSLHQKIEPIVMFAKPHPYIGLRKLIIKLEPGDIQNQLNELGHLWKKFVSHRPFNYSFLDENYNSLYKAEGKINALVYTFSALAIIIACLGMLGLVSYSAVQRTKEIGVRKVLGASVSGIMLLIAKDFMILIFAAIGVAVPVAYYLTFNWLQHFEYRISLQAIHFIGAGFLAFFFATCTIAYQAIKSSRLNPAQTLKSE